MQKKHHFFLVLGVPTFREGGGSTWLGQNPKFFKRESQYMTGVGARVACASKNCALRTREASLTNCPKFQDQSVFTLRAEIIT